MKRQKKQEKNNVRIALSFFIVVSFLIVFSIIIKMVLLIGNSKFDGKHNVMVLFYKESSENGQYFGQLTSFSPDNSSISVLDIKGDKSLEKAGGILSVPLDGKIEVSLKYDLKTPSEMEQILGDSLLNFRTINTDMTIIDIIRLWFFSKSVPKNTIIAKDISIPSTQDISDYFIDYTLSKEKKSIQIINGTEETGLGNRAAKLITNIGGNVVAVSTSDSPLNSSEILYFGEKSYSAKRLGKILKMEVKETNNPGISDIVVKIGKDRIESF